MGEELLFALWFIQPAGWANGVPVLANNVPGLKNWELPMDFGKTFRGHRVLGSHKTFRGLTTAVFAGLLIGCVQMIIARANPDAAIFSRGVDYTTWTAIWLGGAMGLGAIVGDALKSFFKRQIGVRPGSAWVPFDQMDFVVGSLLFSLPFASLDFATYALCAVVMTVLHPVVNIIGWLLRLKKNPF